MIYRGIPIQVNLSVGREVRLHFEESVELGLPPQIATNLVATSVHGILYLTAKQTFESTRVAVKGTQSGRFTLLDLSAFKSTGTARDLHFKRPRVDGEILIVEDASLSAAEVLQHVAQQTLLPRRMKVELDGLSLRSIDSGKLFVYRNAAVSTSVLSVWKSRQWLALAVELQNHAETSHELNPIHLAGMWHSVGFRDSRLLPSGKRGDKSVLFVVGYHDAMLEVRD